MVLGFLVDSVSLAGSFGQHGEIPSLLKIQILAGHGGAHL